MTNVPTRLEPRWPAMLALLAVGGLRLALPESLSVGPSWLLIAVVGVLLIPTAWARQRGLDSLNKILGYVLTSIVTVDMIWSLGLLLSAQPSPEREEASQGWHNRPLVGRHDRQSLLECPANFVPVGMRQTGMRWLLL